MKITNDIRYIGVNDHQVDLFEGQYVVPNGMSYNSYLILDEKIAVMDSVDQRFTHEWLDNIQRELGGRKPDYLVVQHMEPDHSANVHNFLKLYPEAVVVASTKAFAMMQNFFGTDFADRRIEVGDGDTLSLVNFLYFLQDVILNSFNTCNLDQFLRIDLTFSELVTGFDRGTDLQP